MSGFEDGFPYSSDKLNEGQEQIANITLKIGSQMIDIEGKRYLITIESIGKL